MATAWLLAATGSAQKEPELWNEFSDEQRKLISQQPPLRVGITPDWAPLSYFTPDGKAAGIDVDVLHLITQKTGLRFEFIAGSPPWEEIWRMAQAGEVDLTTSTVETEDRKRTFKFTDPYVKSITVIVGRGGDFRFSHLAVLHHANVAQARGHIVSTMFTNRVPAASVIWLDTQKECFDAVARKTADVTVADLFIATQYLNRHPHEKLWICGVIPEFQFPQRLAVRHEHGDLVDILNRALASISQKEKDEILARHLVFTLQGGRRAALITRRLIFAFIGAVTLIGLVVVWNCSIRKEMLARRAAEVELREANRSLEIFSHAVAHDLQGPLRAITGLSEVLQEDCGPKLDSTEKDYLNRIKTAAARMTNVVRGVLAYSQASRAELQMDNISLKQIVDELLGEFPPDQRGFFRVVSDLPNVRAHAGLLGQCIANLLSNALKFVPQGRVPDIRIRAERRDSRVRLWIDDNGAGIAPDDQQRIFRLFQKGPHGNGGTGIGLAVVAKGVERMGGDVGVESKVDQGSRFWIELPKATSNEAE